MRTRTLCVAATLACLPSLVAAQTVLSEADALARLSADSPRVRAIRSAVEVTRAEGLAAARWPNPRVTYNRESVAGVTEKIGLIGTASTTYTEPYNLARQFASLDHISNGRAGWNIVTSWVQGAGPNYGYDSQIEHSERYERAHGPRAAGSVRRDDPGAA